jgi:rSAM/selenodomain-associated transferase 1
LRTLIILFAKAPEAGKVKTRLIPRLGAQGSLDLHNRLVEDTWNRCLLPLAEEQRHLDLALHTDSPTTSWPQLMPRRLQVGSDLGARLEYALSTGLCDGYSQVLVVGGDIPALPAALLADLLDRPEDVALGPVRDGGYYAIKTRRTDPRMFASVRWSTAHAFEDTIAACRACGLTVAAGEPWYDLDTPEDLDALPESVRRMLGCSV